MDNLRVARELARLAREVVADEEDVKLAILREAAKTLSSKLKTDFRVDVGMPDVRGVVYTNHRGVKPRFRSEYESKRGYSVSVSADDKGVTAVLYRGDPKLSRSQRVTATSLRAGAPAKVGAAIAKWVAGFLKSDLKSSYKTDEEPKRAAKAEHLVRERSSGKFFDGRGFNVGREDAKRLSKREADKFDRYSDRFEVIKLLSWREGAEKHYASRGQYTVDDLTSAARNAFERHLGALGLWDGTDADEQVAVMAGNLVQQWFIPNKRLRDFAPSSTAVWNEPIFLRTEIVKAKKLGAELADELADALESGDVDVDDAEVFLRKRLGPLNKVRVSAGKRRETNMDKQRVARELVGLARDLVADQFDHPRMEETLDVLTDASPKLYAWLKKNTRLGPHWVMTYKNRAGMSNSLDAGLGAVQSFYVKEDRQRGGDFWKVDVFANVDGDVVVKSSMPGDRRMFKDITLKWSDLGSPAKVFSRSRLPH